MKHGPRMDHPVGTVPKNESIKIDNDTKIFFGITGLVIFLLQYLLLVKKQTNKKKTTFLRL